MHCLRACLFLTVSTYWRVSHKSWLDLGRVFFNISNNLIFLHVNCILVVIAYPILYINQNNKGKSHTSHSSIKQPTVWASILYLRACNFLVLKLLLLLLGFFLTHYLCSETVNNLFTISIVHYVRDVIVLERA